ncbi:MAG: DUF4263 domain-containing protein [Proteobacteria bacterium]|nr:DUF4263 domain-containing protein [Pseudomonadota bacterium]
MAYRYFGSSAIRVFDKATISEHHPGCVSVEFKPSLEIAQAADFDPEEIENYGPNGVELLFIDGTKDFVKISPVTTTISIGAFLKSKYDKIQTITLDGFSFDTPEHEDDIEAILHEFPTGFVKDYQYGLGLLKELDPIIHSIASIPNVQHLVISTREETRADERFYYLNYEDFEHLRLTLNRVVSRHQRESRKERFRIAHNSLLTVVDPEKYPVQKRPYKKNSIKEMISETTIQDDNISGVDSVAVVDLAKSNKKSIYKYARNEVDEFQADFNLLNLEDVISKSQKLLESKRSGEDKWQILLNDNPIILPLVFGYPVIKIEDQASVGGRTISGSSDKVTDFLVKNSLSNNLAIIEIKKPSTPLIRANSYRDSVYAVSLDLAGSIAQTLDQKYKLQKEIASLKENSGIYDIESYAVECTLVIGTMPEEKDKIKSFELFRNNQKDVKIITFDELIKKMQEIYRLLKTHINNVG